MRHSERRFELRDRTRSKHTKLDAAVGEFKSVADYRRYVAFLGSFRFGMGRIMSDVAWPCDWLWRPTDVSDSIAQDAADLGVRLLPIQTWIAPFENHSALLGAGYVLEGSTLGARILKSRAATLGMTESFGARHLAVMTSDTSCWQSFLRQLDDMEHFDIERAAQAANAVFDLALECIDAETVSST